MKTSALIVLLAAAGSAAAAGTSPGHGVAASAASAAEAASTPSSGNARTQEFQVKHQVPGTLTLFKAQGSVGRNAPIGDDTPLKLLFAGDTEPLDCRIHLSKADAKVQPGETSVVIVQCSQRHRVFNHGMAFEAYENGRKIGEGTLRP